MKGRETAWRVFASELQASIIEERGAGDRAASYLVSPIGARMNRVLMCGTLAGTEALGDDPARPFLRSRLTDPTGTVTVTAGGYQPRALSALRPLGEGQPAMVVGKAHLFVGRTGTAYPSVRAEAVQPLPDSELKSGWSEATAQVLDRIDLVEVARAGRGPPAAANVPAAWLAAATAAAKGYPSADLRAYRIGLSAVVDALDPAVSLPSPVPAEPARSAAVAAPTVREAPTPRAHVTHRPPPVPSPPVVTTAGRAQESAFLDIIDELSDRSADGYADLKEATGLAGRRGVAADEAERLLNRLEEEGVLEEPVVGKIRRA